MGRYLSCFTYLFKYANWTPTVGLGALMMFIPIVGPIVVNGWLIELQRLRVEGDEETLPELSFDRFGELLSLGLQPFLAGLLFIFPMVMLAQFIMAGVIFGGFLVSAVITTALVSILGDLGGLVGVLLTVLLAVVVMGLFMGAMWAFGAIIQVAMLRVEHTGQFSAAFDFGALKDNVSHMAKDMLVGNIIIGIGSIPVAMLGYLMCLIGVFPAIFIISAAGAELRSQVYRSYLAQGHPPIT